MVFDFLNPEPREFCDAPTHRSSRSSETPNQQRQSRKFRRKATNREFLLSYIIEILQAIPLKGSEGQAELLVAEFLGMRETRLFLHELESWLRSPFQRVGGVG